MRLLGIVETFTKDGYLIVKPHVKSVLETMYRDVFDSSGRKLGTVIDVIGRVDNPRIVVKLLDKELGEFLAVRKERVYYSVQRRKVKVN
ncbi:MAG: RNA-binding protein [Desulfurococcaceae archaeon]